MKLFTLSLLCLIFIAGCHTDNTPTEPTKPSPPPEAVPGDDDAPSKLSAQDAMHQLFRSGAIGDDDQPTLTDWQAELMLSIGKAHLEELQAVGKARQGNERFYLSILEECASYGNDPSCEQVHERIWKCSLVCGNRTERYFHMLVEAGPGSYWHTCIDSMGNMGQCPAGTY